MNKQLLILSKTCIKTDNKDNLISIFINDINSTQDYAVNYQYIFTQLLYYSCINDKKWAITFLLELFNTQFDIPSKIALRHTFIYSKYLFKCKKNKNWYENELKAIHYN